MSIGNRLKNELADLKNRYLIDINELTPDEIIRLVHACELLDNPFRNKNKAILDFPVILSDGTKLFSLSLGALIWIQEYCEKWWGGGKNDFMNSCAYTYALAHSRSKDSFEKLVDRETAFETIRNWSMGVNCSQEELEQATSKINGTIEDEYILSDKVEKEKKEEYPKADPDFSFVLNRLEVETGIPIDQWLWGKSVQQTISTYEECEKIISLKSGNLRKSLDDDLSKAVNALASVKKSIYDRLKKKEEFENDIR